MCLLQSLLFGLLHGDGRKSSDFWATIFYQLLCTYFVYFLSLWADARTIAVLHTLATLLRVILNEYYYGYHAQIAVSIFSKLLPIPCYSIT